MTYYFYLSYAIANYDPFVMQFYHDFSETVRQKAGLPSGAAAGIFYLEDFKRRAELEAQVVKALQTCQTMVCLLSPAYFNSEYCGKEWRVFEARRNQYVARKRAEGVEESPPPVIKPVIWIPLRNDPPEVVMKTQYVADGRYGVYNRKGLRYLLKLSSNVRSEYEYFIEDLAEGVLDTAERFVLPPLDHLPPLAEIQSAFHPPAGASEQPSGAGVSAPPPDAKTTGGKIPPLGSISAAARQNKAAQEAEGDKARLKADAGFTGVFISYRRDEAAAYAGRLYDRLAARFGKDKVFLDVANIPWGGDFVEIITAAAESCAAMIVLISRDWSKAKNDAGQPQEEDFVRLEVSKALGRKIPVIPILIQGASMPERRELPDDLQPLANRNGLPLSDTRWERDVEDLAEHLKTLLKA